MKEFPAEEEEVYLGGQYEVMIFRDFPLNKYFYGRPPYYGFVEHIVKRNEDRKVKFEPPFPEWLFSTIRGILDSKYYEYVMYEDMGFANVTRLADFVYAWLGRFTVDKNSRQIRGLDYGERENKDELRLQMAVGLQAVKQ